MTIILNSFKLYWNGVFVHTQINDGGSPQMKQYIIKMYLFPIFWSSYLDYQHLIQ